jgi:hypothetical protein
LRKYVERLNQSFSDYRTDVAERYATIIALHAMEQRWTNMFERIEDKLDRALLYQREHP